MKPLREYLQEGKQSPVEQRAVLEVMAKKFGTSLRPRNTETKVIPFMKAS